jgi:nucleotide-binding universal stress UspA family protein
MKAVQKILVAVDLSDYSLALVQYAAKLAHDLKASIVLVHIVNERDHKVLHNALANLYIDLYERTTDERIAERKAKLTALAKSAEASPLVVKEIVRIDVPYQGLLQTIMEEKPDLLIMGTKGRGALADTVLGSCAQKMFRKSPIPLLSLRPENTH